MSMPGGFVDGESYLESLIESLSTLPAEMRRNLELMKDMDGSCSSLLEETMRMQQEYLRRVEDKMGKLEVVDGTGVRVLTSGQHGTASHTRGDGDSNSDSDSDSNSNSNSDSDSDSDNRNRQISAID